MTQNIRQRIDEEFTSFVNAQQSRFPNDSIRLDLHCHDQNSDIPDELLGRILRSRETWLPTDSLLAQLKRCNQEVFTVTNHNNARSCYQLLDAGHDVLVGAEFTCNVPLYDRVAIHVLTYGFTPEQEETLNQLRSDIFQFLNYTYSHNIPTTLAHPLFYYDPENRTTVELIELFTLLFDNFEVVNGQRDTRQSILLANWLDSLTPEKIDQLGKKHGLNPRDCSLRPYKKAMTGGSDCHMGMFAGTCGTTIGIPDLPQMRQQHSLSELARQGLLQGDVAPFGNRLGGEKMTATFLHFFCQLTMYLNDPGMLRILLHKGTGQEKIIALFILNAVMELRRHKYTSRFLRAFHDALGGKKPGFVIRRMTNKVYRPLISELDSLADARLRGNEEFIDTLESAIPNMFEQLVQVLSARVDTKLKASERFAQTAQSPLPSIENIEVPAYVRTWFKSAAVSNPEANKQLDIASWSDGLPFPALAASCILGANFASAKVQHANRTFLDEFATYTSSPVSPDGVFWLSDTYFEKNGVGNSLKLMREAAIDYNLPFTFAVASSKSAQSPRLHEFSAPFSFDIPFYRDQTFRFVNVMELERTFLNGDYNKLMVSTEGPMGLCGLYLKTAYSVPAYFYLHTDWLEYARQSLHFEPASVDRLRRMLRWFYRQFDGIFVLNTQQADWLCGHEMDIPHHKVHVTAHWCNSLFFPRPVHRQSAVPQLKDGPVMMYAGRLSKEKGVWDLPVVYNTVREKHPTAQLVIVGTGPEKDALSQTLPDAFFIEWVDKSVLANIYAASDIFLFPSTFDTFGNSVLEALSSGVPAVAYNDKGPRDIITSGESGFLVNNQTEMAQAVISLLDDPSSLKKMKLGALKRSRSFERKRILRDMLTHMNIDSKLVENRTEEPASPNVKIA
ncbi:MAG: glycosyltransferase [Deltaproteobacteria bacterium]|nr:glycosyltransferase [Deltaproteobacteria bacterium]MBN2671137.1 glycosyltransferase [Deltaproteobacteria bacterium]